jgi:hypothetical protein
MTGRLPGICFNSYIVCRIHILDLDCFASYYRYLCKNCAIFLPFLELRLSRCRRLPSIAKYKQTSVFLATSIHVIAVNPSTTIANCRLVKYSVEIMAVDGQKLQMLTCRPRWFTASLRAFDHVIG